MSQCGVNIPLSDVVEAIFEHYGSVVVAEVAKRMDLSQYVKAHNGDASNLTLRNSLTVDDAVKGNLCAILQDCITAKIREELGCARDNHVTAFFIDKTKDHLVIDLKFGERYSVSRAEIEDWLKIAAGGIKSGVLVTKDTSPTQVISVTNNDGSVVNIDVSALKNTTVVSGSIVGGQIIRLTRSDDVHVDIDASTLVPNSPYVVSGVFVARDGGHWLDMTRSDNTVVSVDMTEVINRLTQTVFEMVMRAGYRINTQDEDYTIAGDDFNGRSIVRANKNGDQVVTIVKPGSEDFVGKSIIVRKTNGAAGTFVTLNAGAGVSIVPEDATPIRRVGSSVTLVYIGNGVYDAFGELP